MVRVVSLDVVQSVCDGAEPLLVIFPTVVEDRLDVLEPLALLRNRDIDVDGLSLHESLEDCSGPLGIAAVRRRLFSGVFLVRHQVLLFLKQLVWRDPAQLVLVALVLFENSLCSAGRAPN